MPVKLAAFPKCYLDDLTVHHTMTLFDWIETAASLPHVEGVELYPPAMESLDYPYLARVRDALDAVGLSAPMMCASPDFTYPDPARRAAEIEGYVKVVRAVAALGGSTCRILSGQRRPGVGREEGIAWVVDAIEQVLPLAEEQGTVLVMENHYKDGYWEYPEFAQESSIFLEIIGRIDSPWFAVNYDPSNALIAGDDPVEVLESVLPRVRAMHASDRTLEGGTLEDLRRMDRDPMAGYAPFVRHGVVGQGLISYDRVFELLASVGFDGWVSIEDGQDPELGLEHLRDSAIYLHAKLVEHGLR